MCTTFLRSYKLLEIERPAFVLWFLLVRIVVSG